MIFSPNDNKAKGTGWKDYAFADNTSWSKYRKETEVLKDKAFQEKEEYLNQFPEEERVSRRSDMVLKNIKTPAQKELDKGRFEYAHQFYRDWAEKQIKKESFKSNKEYNEALENQGWKDGYEIGYGQGAKSNGLGNFDKALKVR